MVMVYERPYFYKTPIKKKMQKSKLIQRLRHMAEKIHSCRTNVWKLADELENEILICKDCKKRLTFEHQIVTISNKGTFCPRCAIKHLL